MSVNHVRPLSLAPLLLGAACLLATCGPPPDVRARDVDLVYVRSDLMPLSDEGVPQIADAARRLDLSLHVLDADELYGWLDERGGRRGSVESARDSTAAALIAAGGTVHFPALVVRRGGRPLGPAILGYKTAAAYRDLIAWRLAEGTRSGGGASGPFAAVSVDGGGVADGADVPNAADVRDRQDWTDLEVPGDPGAYFRWIPGTSRVAFEMDETIHLLDLETGERVRGPGYVDLIPGPDGRILVTPARNRGGLDIYEVEAVLTAARRGQGAEIRPVHTDPEMRDQYPSVGLLDLRETPRGTVAHYRVLTAWFDRAVFRDYRVTALEGAPGLDVRPTGERVTACRDRRISLPILSGTGRELAARDESTGTTKVFSLEDDGRCIETLDLGVPTGKVAFRGDGRRIAFAVPRGAVRDARGGGYFRMREGEGPALEGVFVLDRDTRRLSLVPGSAAARRLAIPEFVGEEGVAFLLAGEGEDGPSRFRFVRSGRE